MVLSFSCHIVFVTMVVTEFVLSQKVSQLFVALKVQNIGLKSLLSQCHNCHSSERGE